jgi:hypothetical protein
MMSKPQKQHKWLQKMLGEWTSEMESNCGPGQPSTTCVGSESVKSLGDLWIIAEGKGEMPGGDTGHMRLTLGYDPDKKCFVGTWCGSMMSTLWVYEGQLSKNGKVLTLNTTGPDFTRKGKTAKYRDVIEFKTKDHRILSSSTPDKKGKWVTFMTAHYKRKK